jgi:uncharacterized protein (TIGR01777 family)
MRIVITGATGFIGTHLVSTLRKAGHESVPLGRAAWAYGTAEAFEGADAVVHLAGEPVAQRWSPEIKQRIRDSRVLGTERLIQGLSIARNRPQALICASAVGYYGDRGDEALTETSSPGSGFLPDVCCEWEANADLAASLGMRVVKIRTGLVLGPGGGALQQMLTPFKTGVGGRLGSGRQWMPWIHIDDIVGIFRHAIETSVTGPLNGSSPGVVTNADFTAALGRALHRPTMMPVPGFALKLMFGEMGEVMLQSQRALPQATVQSGYKFQYPELGGALASLKL